MQDSQCKDNHSTGDWAERSASERSCAEASCLASALLTGRLPARCDRSSRPQLHQAGDPGQSCRSGQTACVPHVRGAEVSTVYSCSMWDPHVQAHTCSHQLLRSRLSRAQNQRRRGVASAAAPGHEGVQLQHVGDRLRAAPLAALPQQGPQVRHVQTRRLRRSQHPRRRGASDRSAGQGLHQRLVGQNTAQEPCRRQLGV